MGRLRQYFSFQGRLTRVTFWVTFIVATVILFLAATLSVPIAKLAAPLAYLLYVAVVPVLVAWVAAMVRRLHDRNRTGWWAPVFLLGPGFLYYFGLGALSVGSIKQQSAAFLSVVALLLLGWSVIELGLLRGTVGPNRFGPDPLSGAAEPKDA